MKKLIGAILIIIGLIIAGFEALTKTPKSISIIGGSDGPTSIFLAGKTGGFPTPVTIVGSVILIIIGIVLIIKKEK